MSKQVMPYLHCKGCIQSLLFYAQGLADTTDQRHSSVTEQQQPALLSGAVLLSITCLYMGRHSITWQLSVIGYITMMRVFFDLRVAAAEGQNANAPEAWYHRATGFHVRSVRMFP